MMTCPKCHGEMRVYERSNVTIDQCTECRGIFLDRGELEKIFAAEASFNARPGAPGHGPGAPGQAPPPPPYSQHAPHQSHQPGYPPPPPPPPAYGAPAAYPPAAAAYGRPGYGHHGHYRQQQHHGHYRRKSFLHNLFD
ncbi:zf-TFIIB domain-containing protein [Actinoplanes sp. DH11]|uniref:TFIIB-type zinc ribbon-containing protein n=1 Tax=Actinoplanes sp. DH11 TaxID=2857011 RepID=UPI001E50FCDC|nr:zf-TFIIB domain-containing protein [Actinoplanes sp. DH11]